MAADSCRNCQHNPRQSNGWVWELGVIRSANQMKLFQDVFIPVLLLLLHAYQWQINKCLGQIRWWKILWWQFCEQPMKEVGYIVQWLRRTSSTVLDFFVHQARQPKAKPTTFTPWTLSSPMTGYLSRAFLLDRTREWWPHWSKPVLSRRNVYNIPTTGEIFHLEDNTSILGFDTYALMDH